MKKISKLAALPAPDQRLILNLCQHNKYDRVVEILAQPREEGGLALQTNATALCRFNQDHSWLACDTKLMDQFADILNGQTKNEGSDVGKAMTLLVQQRIFNALLSGVEMDQLKFPFRVLFTLQRHQLQHRKLALQENEHTSLPWLSDKEAKDSLEELRQTKVGTPSHINFAPTDISNPDTEQSNTSPETNPPTDTSNEEVLLAPAPIIDIPLQRDDATATEQDPSPNPQSAIRDPQCPTPVLSHISHLAHLSDERDPTANNQFPIQNFNSEFSAPPEISFAPQTPLV